MWDRIYDRNHLLSMRIQAAKDTGMEFHSNELPLELMASLAIPQMFSGFHLSNTLNESMSLPFHHLMERFTFQNMYAHRRLDQNVAHNQNDSQFKNHVTSIMNSDCYGKESVLVQQPIIIESKTGESPHALSTNSASDDATEQAKLVFDREQRGNCHVPNELTSMKFVLSKIQGDTNRKDSSVDSISFKGKNESPHEPFTLQVKTMDQKWLKSYSELLAYKDEFGDCIVPRGYSSNPRLACWVAEQRKQYKLFVDGKYSSINPNRIKLLESIGFAWNAHEAAWDKHYDDLKSYKGKYGDCLVPLMHSKYPKLGLWVKEQRRHFNLFYEGKESHMTRYRVQKLNDIGFCWDTHKFVWNEHFRDLLEFQKEHGHFAVPANYLPNPKLGTWVHHQRRQYKRYREGCLSPLTPERIELLESVGFSWDSRKRGRRSDDLLSVENDYLKKDSLSLKKSPRLLQNEK
jgi:Helicase associated domain